MLPVDIDIFAARLVDRHREAVVRDFFKAADKRIRARCDHFADHPFRAALRTFAAAGAGAAELHQDQVTAHGAAQIALSHENILAAFDDHKAKPAPVLAEDALRRHGVLRSAAGSASGILPAGASARLRIARFVLCGAFPAAAFSLVVRSACAAFSLRHSDSLKKGCPPERASPSVRSYKLTLLFRGSRGTAVRRPVPRSS